MRMVILGTLLCFAVATLAQSIVPRPRQLSTKGGSFTFDRGTRVDADDVAWPEAEKLWKVLGDSVGVMLPANGRTTNVVVYKIDQKRQDLGAEGYELKVTRTVVRATAYKPAGLFYATQTLRQMLPVSRRGRVSVRCVEISDSPRFSWRGLHLDVSRHFFPTSDIKRWIDVAALFKLNVFHWHLTDDGGWRMESIAYPKLTTIGAYRTDTGEIWNGKTLEFPGMNAGKRLYGGYYSQDEIRDVVTYAREHDVTVVPEIELPGHSMAALAAYPELACKIVDPAELARRRYYPQPNVFCAGKEATFTFFEKILDETMELFPSEFIHIGGDEVDKYLWSQCPDCQERMQTEGLANLNELQSYFIKRIEKYINKRGRKLIGWDEILEGGLAPNAAVMSWRGVEGGIAAAKSGHKVVMSPTSHCYFDYPYSMISTEMAYNFEPVPELLTADEAMSVLGGQANVWTEWLDTPEKVEIMMFPRLLAMAETLWTSPQRKSYPDFTKRLATWYPRFEAMKLSYYIPEPELPVSLAVFNKDIVVDFPPTEWTRRYTTDGTAPTLASPALPTKMRFDKRAQLRIATFTGSGRRSEVVEFNAIQSDGIAIQVVGYDVKRYEGRWEILPDFSSLPAVASSRAETVDVSTDGTEWYGLVFSGVFSAPKSGFYTFTCSSDDGSALYIAGAKAIDNDGLHGDVAKSRRVWLDAGSYPIEVRYFQAGGAAKLAATVEGPGVAKRKL